ncbi:MAG: hypothetical protein ILO42_00525 [Clostridia bacterium]|nr:hypothetical protein [Clostridia bacterium]
MSKKLIIAEKPSLARNIASAIKPSPKPVKADGETGSVWYENDSFVIAYAFGHLLSLADAEDYSPDYKAWRSDVLPIVPEKFKYTIRKDRGNRSQYTLLKKLIERDDVDAIVNAGDSDREGEIIIRNIITHTGTKKPVFRLWMPDQTPRTIASELAGMSPDSEYDRLACEGYARTYIDWLYGINLSRMATLKSGRLLRVGRVTSPIVSAICERERLIRNFVPEKYYVALHEDREFGFKLISKKKHPTKEECAELCALYNAAKTVVTGRKTTRKTIKRPRLFALSDLQGEAGRAFGYSPKRTLDILQKLYEDGFVTYPRTNSQYMATAEKKKAEDIIGAIHKAYPGPFDGVVFRDSRDVFDDSKIEAHSGLSPTYKIPDVNAMQADEKNVYRMVFMRFCSVFCREEYVVDRTVLTIENGYETFTLNGDVTVTPGFTKFEPVKKKSASLPPLKEGDEIIPAFAPEEKETTPPDHYTAETLNAYLKNPYSTGEKKALSEDGEDMETVSEVELGTEATRAGLIDAAIKSGYITLKKNKYGITPEGEYYVDSLAALGINMAKDRTLNLGKSLKQVYRGEKEVEDVIAEAASDLRTVCLAAGRHPDAAREYSAAGPAKSFCKCGVCGSDVLFDGRLFSCTGDGCHVKLFKNSAYFNKIGGGITLAQAKELIETGKVKMPDLVSHRNGKHYSAVVSAEFTPEGVKYKMTFPEKEEKKET